jgi:recombination protein RecR
VSSDPIGELVALLSRLPGIGERTATRLAFYVIGADPDYARALGSSLSSIHDRVRKCARCGNFTGDIECAVCRNPERDATVLCVVARVQDLVAIERSGTFRGRYHVLHGLLAPLDGIGPSDLPLDALIDRVRDEGVREVVIATPLSVEGEATALYAAQVLEPLGIAISRIASGVPHGGELEFTDQVTMGRAFEGRRRMGS